MNELFNNPIFWRGLQGTIQTLALLICGIIGFYLAFKKEETKSKIEIESPFLKLIYSGRTLGLVLVVIAMIGLALGLTSGKAQREAKRDGQSESRIDMLKYHGVEKTDWSARDWYLLIAREYDFEKKLPSRQKMEELVTTMRVSSPKMSQSEITTLIKNYNPNEGTLLFLLSDLMERLPYKYKKSDITVGYVGELPGNVPTAVVLTSNGKGVIILSTALVDSLNQWAKPIMAIMIEKSNEPHSQVIKKISDSVKAYVTESELPNFKEYNNSDDTTLALLVSIAGAEFIMAHEYAHLFFGHPNVGEVTLEMEMEADNVAVEMVLHNLPTFYEEEAETKESKRLIPDVQAGLCGIFHTISFLTFIEQCPTALRNMGSARATAMMARHGNIRKKIESEYNIEKMPVVLSYEGLLYLVEKNILTGKPIPINELPRELKTLASYYVAFKENDDLEKRRIIKSLSDELLYVEFVKVLFDKSSFLAQTGLASSSFDWSGGDLLNAADLYKLACSMHMTRLSISRDSPLQTSEKPYEYGKKILNLIKKNRLQYQEHEDYSSKEAVKDIDKQIGLIEEEMKKLIQK